MTATTLPPITSTVVTAEQLAELALACGGREAGIAAPIMAGWRAVLAPVVSEAEAPYCRHTMERIELHGSPEAGEECHLHGRLTARFRHGHGEGLALVLDVAGEHGRRLCRVEAVLQVPGREARPEGVPPDPAPAVQPRGEPIDGGTVTFSPEQVEAYCRAVDDPFGLHLDAETARAAGFAGPVVPGQALLLRLLSSIDDVSAVGPGPIRTIAARFSRPVLVGAAVSWTLRCSDERDVWALDAAVAEGAVLKAARVGGSRP